MQKFSKFLGHTFMFTNNQVEIPDFIIKDLKKLISINLENERIIAACWNHSLFLKGKIVVIITERRIIFKDLVSMSQNFFSDLTGVEIYMKNIILLAPGNDSLLFPDKFTLPSIKLLRIILESINTQWMEVKDTNLNPKPLEESLIDKIEKLGQLKEKGILTEQEFNAKKSELLAKI